MRSLLSQVMRPARLDRTRVSSVQSARLGGAREYAGDTPKMRKGISFLAALAVAAAAYAAEPKKDGKKDDPSTHAQPAETPRDKLEKLKAAKKGAPDPKKAEEAAERAEVSRAKSIYVFAVEACEQPARCDAALRDEAEQRFMGACRACASDERCEAERAAILGGTAKRTANPCAP
jgi:hypothetical protein